MRPPPEKGFSMKEKKTTSQLMRQIAGWLYLVLSAYQIFSLYGCMSVGFGQAPTAWLLEAFFMLVSIAFAIYLIGGQPTLKAPVRRGVVAGTVFVVAFALITFTTQTFMLQYGLWQLFPDRFLSYEEVPPVWTIILLAIRLVLYILAAFFVASSTEEADKKQLAEEIETLIEDEGEDEDDENDVVEVTEEEEIVIVEGEDETDVDANDAKKDE